MLDLKAKLLKAGLVTEDQVEKVEQEQEQERQRKKERREAEKTRRAAGGGPGKGPRGPADGKGREAKGRGDGRGGKGRGKGRGPGRPGSEAPPDDGELWQKRVKKLAAAGKAEQYDAVRGWVERTRLDAVKGLPSENADRFHFDKGDGTISWVTVEPDVAAKLKEGQAGIIGFMSFNGLAFCVVPREVALDVHQVRPDWLRALSDFTFDLLPIEATGKKKKKRTDDEGEGAGSDAAAGPSLDEVPAAQTALPSEGGGAEAAARAAAGADPASSPIPEEPSAADGAAGEPSAG